MKKETLIKRLIKQHIVLGEVEDDKTHSSSQNSEFVFSKSSVLKKQTDDERYAIELQSNLVFLWRCEQYKKYRENKADFYNEHQTIKRGFETWADSNYNDFKDWLFDFIMIQGGLDNENK